MSWSLTSEHNGTVFSARQDNGGPVKLSGSMNGVLQMRGIDLYGDITEPIVRYKAIGPDDPVAAYLNVVLNMPGDIEESGTVPTGTPRFTYTDDYGPSAAPIPRKPASTSGTKQLPIPFMGPKHDGAMVALIPDTESAKRLAVPGGDPVEQLHLTLAYLGDAVNFREADSDLIIALIRATMPTNNANVVASVNGAGRLGDDATVYLIGDSSDLKMFYDKVTHDLQAVLTWDVTLPPAREPFIAHVTAGENIPVDNLTYRGPITFDRLRVAFGGEQTDFLLAPEAPADDAITVDRPNGPVTVRKSLSDDPGTVLGVSVPAETKTLKVGTRVTWHYRSAIGHGTISGIAEQGKDEASTKYNIRESDHHVSSTGSREKAIVQHYGSALTVVKSSVDEFLAEVKAISPGGRPINYSTLDRSPKVNWVERAGGLPRYIRGVARGIAKRHGGKVTSRDIATAISRMKVWAAGGDHVRPAVQAAAAKAVAEWEALKAKAHLKKSLEDFIADTEDDPDDDGLSTMLKVLSDIDLHGEDR